VTEPAWEVGLSAAADADFDEIVRWTARQFGVAQARVYAKALTDTLAALRAGPATAGIRRREDLGSAVCTLHMARSARRSRHLIVCRFRRHDDERFVDVIRILHDAMDLGRHLPPDQTEK
jgi:toxin ParE1/3/4